MTDPGRVATLLRAIDAHEGQPAIPAALRLLALTFVRPRRTAKGHVERVRPQRRHLADTGRAHEHETQARRAAVVAGTGSAHRSAADHGPPPLCLRGQPARAIALREHAQHRTPHARLPRQRITAHAFRTVASALLHELGWPPEVIELQLAHAQRNQVAPAYNRSARLEERRRIMQAWADYLDMLREGGANVVPINFAG